MSLSSSCCPWKEKIQNYFKNHRYNLLFYKLIHYLWPQSDSSAGYKEKSPINQSNRTKSQNRWPNSEVKNTFTDLIAFKRNTQILCKNTRISFDNSIPFRDNARQTETWRKRRSLKSRRDHTFLNNLPWKQDQKMQTSIYNKQNGTQLIKWQKVN